MHPRQAKSAGKLEEPTSNAYSSENTSVTYNWTIARVQKAQSKCRISLRLVGASLALLFILVSPVSMHAQGLPNLSGAWTGQRTETGDLHTPPVSEQVLTLYQIETGGPVAGMLVTYWPGTPYHWGAVASGALLGDILTLTWTIIPSTVNMPPGSEACGATLNLTLSTSHGITTANVPSYHPCGEGNTVEPYTLTLIGWQKMLGQDGDTCPFCGDPIDVATGNVFETVKDYETAGANKLSFIRSYNSFAPNAPLASLVPVMGIPHWTTNYDRSLVINVARTQVIANRPDGQELAFNLVQGNWAPDSDVDMALTQNGNIWNLQGHDDTSESYTMTAPAGQAGSGLLDSIELRNGYSQTMAYDGSNQLVSVTDSYGRQLIFSYANGLLTQVTTPDTLVLSYSYNSSGVHHGVNDRLASVSYNTNPVSSQSYGYGNGSFPFALTSITDELGNAYTSFNYDSYGRALTSQHAGGADLTSVTYNDGAGTRTVQNALGQPATYTTTALQGANKTVQIQRAATRTTPAATETFGYDSNGYLASRVDWNGDHTTYVNDSHGDPTTIKEAVGSPVARTTTIVYDSTFVHLPHSVATAGVTTTYTYDSSGDTLTKTLTDTTTQNVPYSTNGETHTWSYRWDNSLLASAETPNGNTTTYEYSGSGALIKITNPLSQETNITGFTGGGYPLTMTDPNNVLTTLTYDQRLRLTSSAVTTRQSVLTTTYAINAAGELTRKTLQDNSYLAYAYDQAHRQTQVTDTLGNYVKYTLDALGDKTQTNTYDSGGNLKRQHSATFDALGRMLQDIGGVGQTTKYSYDSDGNALTITDPLNLTTTRVFDALNRLSRSTDARGGVTRYSYDPHDRPLTVTDSDGNVTAFVYDGFGNAIQQASPDSGTSVNYYDNDDNLVQKIDALHVVANKTWDAMDRLLTTQYPADSTLNVAYTYDQTGSGFRFGIGRLTSLTDPAGSLTRSYDERGNLLTEQRTSGSHILTTTYTYDPAARVSTVVYPSGSLITYLYDMAGYVQQVKARPVGTPVTTTLATLAHLPFGPIDSVTYGNGIAEPWSFDADYRPTNITDRRFGTTLQNLTYGYDADDNVLSITDAVNGANSQTLGYGTLNRVASAVSGSGGYGNLSWTYSLNGNVQSFTNNSTNTTYSYASGSNRLTGITVGSTHTTVATNADGNITSIPPANNGSPATFTYNKAGRLASVAGSPLAATFVYDAFGQRFSKTNPGETAILYAYNQASTLIEENNNGAITDYVYADGRPITALAVGRGLPQTDYVLADRLGTPQLVSSATGSTVWSTTYQPFGTTGNITGSITQDLRFPGQYSDVETGFRYNINRDYMPNIGRYLETDPIGLAGGLNPYGYVGGNPLARIDRNGQFLQFVIPVVVLILTPGNDADFLAASLGTLAGGIAGPFGGSLEASLGGGKFCQGLADFFTDQDVDTLVEHLISSAFAFRPQTSISNEIPLSNPNWIPIGDGLYYYDDAGALGAQ
jgi:RHS repeat-associated protein